MTEIRHPETGEIIEGTQLQPGDVIQRGDKYDAQNRWETCSYLVGRVIEQGCRSIWVREG